MHPCLLRIVFLLLCFTGAQGGQAQVSPGLRPFVAELDSIRVALRIPALAVGVVQDDVITVETGLGYADVARRIKATANTSFRIASLTKTFTSTLALQLVEQGKLNLDTPITAYGLNLGNPRITVRHLLTHTSEGEPGTHYQYNGYRFGQLGPILEQAAGMPFHQLLLERIVQPLRLASTAPGISLAEYFAYTRRRPALRPYFKTAFRHLAQPYDLNEKGAVVASRYYDEFGAFGGLTSTVKDVLRYAAAIDHHRLVSARTQQQIFTPYRTADGRPTPYGLGWFTQTYRGLDFYWHYGQTQGESGLLVMVPARHLTLVVLANTSKLSQPFQLGDGDVLMSPVGQLLYKYVLNTDPQLVRLNYRLPEPALRAALLAAGPGPYREFYNKEVVAQAAMSLVHRDTTRAQQLYAAYADLNFQPMAAAPTEKVIASLQRVGINQDVTTSFTLASATRLHVYGVGENCSADLTTWCDYGAIEDVSGHVVWQMPGQPAQSAGGAVKNQRVDQLVTLAAGRYRLRYKSDGGHAYNNWDSAPPDHFFWGIVVAQPLSATGE